MYPTDEIEIEQKILTALKFTFQQKFTRRAMRNIEFDVFIEHLSGLINTRIKLEVYGEDMGSKDVITYPKDWWEAFKERWFPRFILKKHPVKYKVFKISAKALYPEFKPVRGHGAIVAHYTIKDYDDKMLYAYPERVNEDLSEYRHDQKLSPHDLCTIKESP